MQDNKYKLEFDITKNKVKVNERMKLYIINHWNLKVEKLSISWCPKGYYKKIPKRVFIKNWALTLILT